jgi:septal ring factor EnvC (AmiA/AmiB activator)
VTGLLAVFVGVLVGAGTGTPPPSTVAGSEAVARARAALSRETSVLDRIDALDRLISHLALQAHALEERLAAREARVAEITAERARITASMGERRTLVQQRLRARSRLDEAAYVRVLLGAHDPTEIVHRREYLRRVLENDARLLRDLRTAETTVAALGAEQQAIIETISRDRSALVKQRESLETERRTRMAVLAALRHERDALRRLVGEQEAAAAAFAFDRTAPPGLSGFAAERGRLPYPAAGAIARGYGRQEDPELGTSVFRKGVEIDALVGAPVRAVHAGRVAYADWYKGFGNLVVLAHGDGYHTLYGHLARVDRTVGETVAVGDPVGLVGDTGSLRGPVLYFEIREGQRSVDPGEWLSAAQGVAGAERSRRSRSRPRRPPEAGPGAASQPAPQGDP